MTTIFCDMTPCKSLSTFRRRYCLGLQGWRVSRVRNTGSLNLWWWTLCTEMGLSREKLLTYLNKMDSGKLENHIFRCRPDGYINVGRSFRKRPWSRNKLCLQLHPWKEDKSTRRCATSRKVAGSIPNEIIGFFNWSNPSSRTMARGSTQPLTEMSTRRLPGGKGLPARKAGSVTTSCEPIF
jgi:hypothetical protein